MTLHRALWLALIVIAPLTGREVVAQSGRTEKIDVSNFRIQDVGGRITLDNRYRSDHEQRRGGGSTSEQELVFRQTLDLNIRSYILHPNFIDLQTDFTVGLNEQFFDTDGEQAEDVGTILGYDLRAEVLREKLVSARLFANRSDERINRGIASSIDLVTQAEGFEIHLDLPVHMSVRFEHSQLDEESDTRRAERETYDYRYQASNSRGEPFHFLFSYEYEDTDETNTLINRFGPDTTQDLPDQRHELNFDHVLTFGDDRRPHRLTGRAQSLSRRGAFENDRIIIDERLDLQHSEDLRSFYRGSFLSNETQAQSETRYAGEAGFSVSIYESLDITARTFGSRREFDDGSESFVGGDLDLDYRKRTPIGTYRSSLGLGVTFHDEQSDTGTRQVIDEAVTLSGVTSVTLSQPNILPGSVIVTDANNLVMYVQGLDYALTALGSFVQIERLVTGSIGDGETVLVDYIAAVGQDSQFYRSNIDMLHRIDFDDLPLSVFFRYRLVDETLADGDDPGNLQRVESLIFGGEVFAGPVTLAAEYEMREQNLSPDERILRSRVTYHRRLSRDHALRVAGFYTMTDFLDAEAFDFASGRDFQESYGINAALTGKLSRNLLGRLEAGYSNHRGRNRSELIRVGGSLDWRYGLMSVSLTGHVDFWEQESDEGQRGFVGLKVEREF